LPEDEVIEHALAPEKAPTWSERVTSQLHFTPFPGIK
jgi:hypothetical protein